MLDSSDEAIHNKSSKPEMIKTIETRISETSLGEDGIIYGVITEPNAHETLQDAIEILDAIRELSQGKPAYILSDVRNLVSADSDALEYFASEESRKLVKANAMVSKSLLTRSLINLYLLVNKPQYPMSVFKSFDAAANWLKRMKEDQSLH